MAAKKNKRSKKKKVFKPADNIFVKIIIFTIVLASVVAGAYLGFSYVLYNNANFKLDNISLEMPYEYQGRFSGLSSYLGEPIFKVDLDELADYSPNKYPYFKYLRAVRMLPNSVVLEAEPREPIARLSSGKLFDVQKVVFPNVLDKDYTQLPVIYGIDSASKMLGKPLSTDSAEIASFVLSKQEKIRQAISCDIKEVDVNNPSDASFTLKDNDIEIRIGDSDLEKRIFLLSSIASDLGEEFSQIKYIDLRFKDPVIGYR